MLVFVSLAPMSGPHFPVPAANLEIWAGLGNEVRQLFCLSLFHPTRHHLTFSEH